MVIEKSKLIKIITLIFLILFFYSNFLSKADDIKDFEIEGMGIGDSLLNFFNEKQIIDNNPGYKYHSDEFYATVFYDEKFYKTYESLEIHLKKNDKKYMIYAIDGLIFYDDINKCYSKQKEITKEIGSIFKNIDMVDVGTRKLSGDKSGKSTSKTFYWEFGFGNFIAVECYDWSKEILKKNGWHDNLRISIISKELNDWLKMN